MWLATKAASRAAGSAAAGRAALPGRGQLLHMLAHQREQQVFLGREIAVERGRLHADLGGELAHRHGLIAMPRDQHLTAAARIAASVFSPSDPVVRAKLASQSMQ